MATFRTHDPTLGKWWNVDPAADILTEYSPYNSMMNSPLSLNDTEGDCPVCIGIITGAAIGAGLSGVTTIATNAVTGNDLFQGFGRSVAFGAIGGAISGGMSSLFAGSAFGQSLSFGVLNNTISTAATNAILGQDITLGSIVGSIAGGLVGGVIPNFTGVQGGNLNNIIAEFAYKSTVGAITGGISGGFSAALSGEDVNAGIANGLKYGAISGGVQAGLNILAFGPAYLPPRKYGSFGHYQPVYRKGTFLTRLAGSGTGVTIGGNLVTNEMTPQEAATNKVDQTKYNHFLRAHETAHYDQQIRMGFGSFYARTMRDYLKYGFYNTYGTPGTLEYKADIYAFKLLGYKY